MISDIKEAIIDKLYALYPSVTIYDEDNIPQSFDEPSFLVTTVEHNYDKRLDNKFRGEVLFDIAYFSDKDTHEIKSDCLDKQVVLLRGLACVCTFRAINLQATITDNVLHITGTVSYSEIKAVEGTKMEAHTTNTELDKE